VQQLEDFSAAKLREVGSLELEVAELRRELAGARALAGPAACGAHGRR
jgi:hypothetical protein